MSVVSDYQFNLEPRNVPLVETRHRRIVTQIPAPGALDVFETIRKYESSNVREQLPVVWDRAQGHLVYDPWGNRFIDFTSTIFVTNAGHGHPLVSRRLREMLDGPLMHSYTYPTKIRAEYVRRLVEFTPPYLEKVSLFSTGTEASERAIKLSRLHGMRFSPRKLTVVGGKGNFHGKTMGAQMAGGQDAGKEWIGHLDPNMVQMPFPYPWVLENTDRTGEELFHDHLRGLEAQGTDLESIAAFFVETFQGWGAIFYPIDYIQAMRRWSQKHGALLVFDEIQAGFGRTGRLFAYEHYDVEPDLVICGKAISSSMPLSAVLGRGELIDLDPAYTSTHGGNPLACAAGLGNIEAFERDDLVAEAARKQEIFVDELRRWKRRFPERIGRIYGSGMLFGVFISRPGAGDDPDGRDATFTDRIVERAMEKGVFSIRTGCGTIKLGPPLSIPDDALVEGLRVYEECIAELMSENGETPLEIAPKGEGVEA